MKENFFSVPHCSGLSLPRLLAQKVGDQESDRT